MTEGWIGVDLDRTLAYYDVWRGVDHIGEPVPAMLERVRGWLDQGRDVRIFTARVNPERPAEAVAAHIVIGEWCKRHLGQKLQTTCEKDYDMLELWDDRVVQVAPNIGQPVGLHPSGVPYDAYCAQLQGELHRQEQLAGYLTMVHNAAKELLKVRPSIVGEEWLLLDTLVNPREEES